MSSGIFFGLVLKFFNVLGWPSFALMCPLYASIKAIESNTHSKYQACLTYWVLCSVAAVLESMLAKPLAWIPFWPYAKGMAILLLVVPYFRGAYFVYSHLLIPYTREISGISNVSVIPKAKVSILTEQNCIFDSAESFIREKREDESEKVVIYEVEHKSNQDARENGLPHTTSSKKTHEWSCPLCLVSTTSKKCLQNHFQGKKHKAKEEECRRNEAVTNKTTSSSLTTKLGDRTTSIGNLNRVKWVNLRKLSNLLGPVTRSISWFTWKKPEIGWTKLNADGSVDRESAGFGGLLRDYKGEPICAYASKFPGDDIFLVESLAIWRGLILASRLGVKAIWVESDSMSVVKTINKEQPYGPRASRCLRHIWKLLKKFEKYKVSHSWRESNRAADYISKMDIVGSDVVLWPAEFPDRLWNIIHDDAQGRWYRRA
ncbi:hypothetical protein NMG60_11016659 [Bertholletia excelsa]